MDCIYFAVVMVTTVGFGAKRRQFCADFDWNRINLPRRARDECKELRSNGVYVSAGDFEALFLRDRLFASAYVLFGTIIVGFCVSVIVEVSLNLEGEERKAELHRLFKVRSPTLQLALQQQHHSIYRTYNSTYSAAHCSTLPFRTVRAHWRASSVVYQ